MFLVYWSRNLTRFLTLSKDVFTSCSRVVRILFYKWNMGNATDVNFFFSMIIFFVESVRPGTEGDGPDVRGQTGRSGRCS